MQPGGLSEASSEGRYAISQRIPNECVSRGLERDSIRSEVGSSCACKRRLRQAVFASKRPGASPLRRRLDLVEPVGAALRISDTGASSVSAAPDRRGRRNWRRRRLGNRNDRRQTAARSATVREHQRNSDCPNRSGRCRRPSGTYACRTIWKTRGVVRQ